MKMLYYSAVKKSEIMHVADNWAEKVIVSEAAQIHKDKHWIFFLIGGS